MLSPELGQFWDNARAAAGVLIFGSIGDGKYLVGVEPVMCRAIVGRLSWIFAQSLTERWEDHTLAALPDW
jgi:hypothetical protein